MSAAAWYDGQKGVGTTLYTDTYDSPLGEILLASDGEKLTGLWFVGQAHCAAGLSPAARRQTLPIFEETKAWLAIYFRGETPPAPPPLAFTSTPFRAAVWKRLLAVPYGSTATYGSIARDIGCASARAVGSAVGHNPISIIVPCHRVVGSDGRLTGYAGGLARKTALLALEKGK